MYTKKSGTPHFMGFRYSLKRAIDGTRTRGFHLGKVALYQLSHYRITVRQSLELRLVYGNSGSLSSRIYLFF